MLRVVLVHAGAVILPELGERLGTYAQKKLAERGVEIRINTKAKQFGRAFLKKYAPQRLPPVKWICRCAPKSD